MEKIDQRRLAALEARVARLEERPTTTATSAASPPEAPTPAALSAPAAPAAPAVAARAAAGEDALGLLTRLRARLPDDGGAVTYAGAVGGGGREFLWAAEHGARDVTGADPAAVAAVLVALASPARLVLLSALLPGPLGRAGLQAALGESTTGHLYHHLRELQAAGLIHQPRRGEYDLVASAVVPALAIVAAAGDLAARNADSAAHIPDPAALTPGHLPPGGSA